MFVAFFHRNQKVLGMLKDVREAAEKSAFKGSPVLVHCSAGVGRTGTFIAIDWALRMLERDGKFNVEDTIRRLRQDRVSIVQTVDQYVSKQNPAPPELNAKQRDS